MGLPRQLTERERDRFWAHFPPLDTNAQRLEQITLVIDPDVLAFFRNGGRGYQRRINQVLEFFVQEQNRRRTRGEAMWRLSDLRRRPPMPERVPVTLRTRAFVIEWFRSLGPGHYTRMNEVLRMYVDRQLGAAEGG